MPLGPDGRIARYRPEVNGHPEVTAYQVDASPALTVLHGLLELAPRRPALLVSGINFGENMGSDIPTSGTVGAALQGAACGITSMAVSLQTPKEMHIHPSDGVDFGAAIHFARLVARLMLQVPLPFDVDLLKVDVPDDATPETPWRLTRVSRHASFDVVPPRRADLAEPLRIDYEPTTRPERAEPDSDLYALRVDRVVSVAPVSLDLTSRTDFGELEALLCGLAER